MVNSRLSCKEATGNGSEEEGEEQNSPSCARRLLLYRLHEWPALAGGPVMPSAPSISRLLPLAPSVLSCPVRRHFLPFLLAVVCSYLATLSCKPHPVCAAAGQTLSLRDAKDISQASASAAQARYRHNWLLPAAEVLGRQNESEKSN